MNSERLAQYLTRTIIILAGVALFVPIVMHSQFFFPFIVPKNILFSIVVELMFGAYLLLLWVQPSVRPQFKNPVIASVAAFFVVSIVATITGIGIYRSVWGNYERMGGMFHFAHVIAYFFILASVLKSERIWHGLLSFSIFVSILMSLVGFAQWLGVPFLLASSGGARLTATVGNAAFFAGYLLINLFFIFYFCIRPRNFDIKTFGWSFIVLDGCILGGAILRTLFVNIDWGVLDALKLPLLEQAKVALQNPESATGALWLLGAFVLFQVVALFAWLYRDRQEVMWGVLTLLGLFDFFILFNTQTRGALIGLVVGFFVMAILVVMAHPSRQLKQVAYGTLVLVLLIPIGIWLLRNSPLITNNGTLNRLATISLSDITTQSRITTWRASWEGWTENPKIFLIGVGPENYYYAFNKHFPVEIYHDSGSQIWFDHAHNIIFDTGVSTGIVGLIAYLSIFGGASYLLYRQYRSDGEILVPALLFGLLIAYGIQNLFVFDTINTEVLIYAVLAFIVVVTLTSLESKESVDEKEKYKPLNPIYAAIVCVSVVVVIVGVDVQIARANRYIYKAFTTSDTTAKENYFKMAIEKSITGTFEAREQFADYVSGLAKNAQAPSPALTSDISYVEDQFQKTIATEPLNIRHHLYLSTFYNGVARFDASAPQKAVDELEPAVDLSPSRPQIYFELGQSYALLGQLDKGTQYFVKGVDLAPTVIDSHWNLMAFYIVTGKQDLAREQYNQLLALGWQPTPDDYKKLISIYGRVDNFSEMVRLSQLLIAQEPSAENYAELAAIYARMGDNKNARIAVQQAVTINPSFAAEAKIFLQKLDAGELKAKK